MAETDTANSPNPQSPTATDDTPTDISSSWHSVLVVEGVRTSDRREFKPGSLRWRTPPLPLMMQLQTAERHQGSVVVGRIDRIERIDNEIHGWGTFDLGSENGREAHRLVSEQILRGVSIDAELFEVDREKLMAEDDGEIALVVEEARIGAATIVSLPAFPQAVIALEDTEIPAATEDGRGEAFARNRKQDIAICMSECKGNRDCMSDCMHKKGYSTELSIITDADFDESFTISELAWNGATSNFTDEEYKRSSAACRGSDAPPKSDCFLPHHDPSGALNRAGLAAAASRFNQTNAPSAALSRARSHLRNHYRQLKEDPPKTLMQMALVAHAEQQGPPVDWFVDPELKGPTPLTIARNGRVYGHAALWDACHTGYKECMKPPRSRTNYAHFLVGSVFPSDCDCDDAIATGPIVLGTFHANGYAAAEGARSHYDNTGQAVADVVVGEDAFGIWVAGSLRPGVSDAQIRALRGSSLSGDWRYIGGNYELIGLLAVNTPGFPVPRVTATFDSGIQVSLVAAGIPEDTREPDDSPTGSDPADILEQLKREHQEKVNGTDNTSEEEKEEEGSTDEVTPDDEEPALDSDSDSSDADPEPSSPAPTPETSSTSASELLSALKTTVTPTT